MPNILKTKPRHTAFDEWRNWGMDYLNFAEMV